MLQLPSALKLTLERILTDLKGEKVVIQNFVPASGGCINNGGKLETSKGLFFVKWNSSLKYPGMFHAEATGLSFLRSTQTLDVPQPLHSEEEDEIQFLLMDFIESSPTNQQYWENLGAGLAALHKNSSKNFGLDYSNYIGSLGQSNRRNNSWVDFFIQERLEKQIALTDPNGPEIKILRKKFEQLYTKLPEILSEEPPSLLHGDLWGGNIMVNHKGEPAIIDPAVYYGNREVDIAMTLLFGGFQKEFYESYKHYFPLEAGYKDRLEIYNLYPLLVHLNLFGGSYLQQLLAVLRRFV
jgi:protein-ribulosamine 3-kinase